LQLVSARLLLLLLLLLPIFCNFMEHFNERITMSSIDTIKERCIGGTCGLIIEKPRAMSMLFSAQ
jgi:hypothetical protein